MLWLWLFFQLFGLGLWGAVLLGAPLWHLVLTVAEVPTKFIFGVDVLTSQAELIDHPVELLYCVAFGQSLSQVYVQTESPIEDLEQVCLDCRTAGFILLDQLHILSSQLIQVHHLIAEQRWVFEKPLN